MCFAPLEFGGRLPAHFWIGHGALFFHRSFASCSSLSNNAASAKTRPQFLHTCVCVRSLKYVFPDEHSGHLIFSMPIYTTRTQDCQGFFFEVTKWALRPIYLFANGLYCFAMTPWLNQKIPFSPAAGSSPAKVSPCRLVFYFREGLCLKSKKNISRS